MNKWIFTFTIAILENMCLNGYFSKDGHIFRIYAIGDAVQLARRLLGKVISGIRRDMERREGQDYQ